MNLLPDIILLRIKIRKAGHVPVSMEIWEQDDDGLMYLNSLTEQYEHIQETTSLCINSRGDVTAQGPS